MNDSTVRFGKPDRVGNSIKRGNPGTPIGHEKKSRRTDRTDQPVSNSAAKNKLQKTG